MIRCWSIRPDNDGHWAEQMVRVTRTKADDSCDTNQVEEKKKISPLQGFASK